MITSKLDIILGPMFSGKTTKLLEIIENLDSTNKKYLVIKPQIDDRYLNDQKNFIVSHNFIKKECIVTTDLKKILSELKPSQFEYILIDEAQFFPDLYNFTVSCLEKLNINVIVTGLDGDYLRKPMGEILNLLPIADSITKLKSKCNTCGKEAIFTHRISAEKEQVIIGGSDKYIPLCRNHYTIENKLNTLSINF